MSAPRWPAHFVLAAGVVAAGLSTVGATGITQQTEPQIDALFESWTAGRSPGCAVSVMRHGEIVFSKGYGLANLEYDIQITPSSVFHVASVSKQFTALAVQLLVNDERVSWDDDIRDYVSELTGLDQPVTLRELAHHTSGIRDQWSLLQMAGWRFEADVVTMQDVLDLLSRQTATNFEPGEAFLYSNSGYSLLALVVERVSGQTLRAFANDRIFTPLGMTSTHFHDDHQMIVPHRAYAYAADGVGFRSSIPDFDIVGATSLFTTVEDLARWDRNFYVFEVGGEDGLARLHEPGILNDGRATTYAFGLAHGTHRGLATVGHGGTDAGYRTEFLRFPDRLLSVAVLCNLRSADPAALARRVADVHLAESDRPTPRGSSARAETTRRDGGRPAERPVAATPSLSHLAGYYRRTGSDVPLHLVERRGGLVSIGSGPTLRFSPTDDRRFVVAGDLSTSAEFPVDRATGVTTLRLGDTHPETYQRSDAWRPTPADLAAFRGSYASSELDVKYSFSVRDRRLVLWHRKLGSIRLVPTYADGFYGGGLYLSFERDGAHGVSGFTVSTPRAWKVSFVKLAAGSLP